MMSKARRVMTFVLVFALMVSGMVFQFNGTQDVFASYTQVANPRVGDTIQFGNYTWRVLDVQGGRALIITDVALDVRVRDHIRAHRQT